MAKLQLPTFRHLFASTFSFVKIEMPRRGECEETLSLLAGIGSGCCVALELLAEVARSVAQGFTVAGSGFCKRGCPVSVESSLRCLRWVSPRSQQRRLIGSTCLSDR